MTIETFFEVNCDACGDSHHDDQSGTKAEVWEDLKRCGWKRRKQYIWCPDCVKLGHYKTGFVDWLGGTVIKS
jgi:hypothetical protein